MDTPVGDIARYSLYGEAVGTTRTSFLHIEDIAARSRLHDWRISAHAHPGMMQIVLVEQGEAYLDADSRRLAMPIPGLSLIPGGHVHAFTFDPQTVGWVLTISEGLLSDAQMAGIGGVGAEAFARLILLALPEGGEQCSRLSWLMRDLARQHIRDRSAKDAVLIWLTGLILSEILECADSHSITDFADRGAMQLLRSFRNLVEQHYREHWSVERYASELGVGRGKLNRICRTLASKSPGEMVLDRLLAEAERYLIYTAASAAQIGYQLGFADPGYFSRFFKGRTGMTPIEYRTRHLGKA
jgi:AraC family transcriptional regulator, transcriptional activator of pobA